MAIEWNQTLSVGVPGIDDQHKRLFEMANQLFEAGKNNKTKEFITEMLDFLGKYTKQHFQSEETYMKSIGFPGLDAQKKMHSDFIAAFTKLVEDYNSSGGNILVILNANQMVLDWLLKHVSVEDKKIGEFVRASK